MRRLHLNRDLVAGLMFVVWGVAGLWIASDYPRGTALRMGPGYMPLLLCWGLVILGGVIAIKGLMTTGVSLTAWHLRPLILVLAAIVAFAVLIEPAGLAIATVAIVLIGAAGGIEFRWREALALALGLALICVVLFVQILGQPFAVWAF